MGNDHPLSRLTSDQFIRLAHATGLPVSQSVLDNLERRKLLVVPENDEAPYSRAHLYVLAAYYDAVRVYRHPWGADSSDRTIEEVRSIAEVVGKINEAAEKGRVGASLRSDASDLVLEMERYLNTIDPYGPLANVVDFLKSDVVGRLQGDGRLYAELRSVAAAVAALVDEDSRLEEHSPTGEVEAPPEQFERPQTVTTTLETEAVNRAEITPSSGLPAAENPTKPSPPVVPPDDEIIELEDEVEIDVSPTDEGGGEPADAEASEPSEVSEVSEASEASEVSEVSEASEPSEVSEVSEPSEVSEEMDSDADADSEPRTESTVETPALPEDESESSEPTESVEDAENDSESTEDEDLLEADEPTGEIPVSEAPTIDDDEPIELVEAVDEVETKQEDETDDELDGDFEAEKTAEIQIPLPNEHQERNEPASAPPETPKPDRDFGRDAGQRTGRTRNLMDRLEELRNRDRQAAKEREEAPERDQATIENQIDELNKLREKFLAEQDWKALADLYVDRIDLFEEEPERQQIHLALATIYEAKLENPQKAMERFIVAFETQGPGRSKALAGARRLAREDSLANSFYDWLSDYLDHASPREQEMLQPDIARAYHREGENQRAFLTLASHLHQKPDERITPESLEALETYSLGLDDSELDGFYDDILDDDPSDAIIELVGLRAAQNRASRGESHHALRYFRMALDVAPANQVAFNNVSRIYESDGNYGELAELIESRLAYASDEDERERLRQDLARVREAAIGGEEATPESLADQLEENPDDRELLHRTVAAFAEAEQLADAYGVLNRVFDAVDDDEQKVDILVNLASIAVTALRAPEEAEVHLNLALDIGGPKPAVLGGLAQMHVANKDWMNAVSSVESILASAPSDTPAPLMVKWLELGIEAAEKAHRGEEKAAFVGALQKYDPEHELV